jgi:heme-degrading monooxygenase HmoA
MAMVSIYTVGRLHHPYDHPASREFYEVGNKVFRQATKSGQLIEAFSSDGVPFPEEAVKGDGYPILTLTVWNSLQALYEFTYSGHHRQALRDRSRWMEPYQEKHLSYVLWWTEKLKDVSWEEAFKRYNYYIQHGSTPCAFDFKNAFDEKGESCMVM